MRLCRREGKREKKEENTSAGAIRSTAINARGRRNSSRKEKKKKKTTTPAVRVTFGEKEAQKVARTP